MVESGCSDQHIDFKPLKRGGALGGAAEASHVRKQRHLKDEVERLVSQVKEMEHARIKNFETEYVSVIRTAR